MIPHLPALTAVLATRNGRKLPLRSCIRRIFLSVGLATIAMLPTFGQTCPGGTTSTNLASFPNTYFAGAFGFLGANITYAAGSTSIGYQASTTGYQGAGTTLNVGDQILIIQMQGVVINTGNTIVYGDGTSGAGYTNNTPLLAGLMEFNTVTGFGIGTVNLATATVNAYRSENYAAGGNGNYRYQIIKVNTLAFVTLTANIAPPAWNGSVGGVLVLSSTKTINFNGKTIDASGTGFRGGGGRSLGGDASGSTNADYRYVSTANVHGSKGEGIAGTPRYIFDLAQSTTAVTNTGAEGYPNGSNARGAPGSGGGGGTDGNPSANDQNSGGGGGGGSAGPGGIGGNAWNSGLAVGGLGGKNLAQLTPNRLVLGGGGGAGSTNNATGTPGSGVASSGATGGGIVIVIANATVGTGTINVSGGNANNTVLNDASGGGGGGGSVLMYITNTAGISSVSIIAAGGNGGTNAPGAGVSEHGPGGGGGGGVIYTNGNTPASVNVAGGANGTTTTSAGAVSAFGAVAGTQGFYLNTTTTANIPSNSRTCQVIALPVTLTDFSGTLKDDNTVGLAWQTSAEIDFSHFVVERSSDAVHFAAVGDVAAASGDGSTKSYGYSDPLDNAAGDVFYYRLKMLDLDNSFAYSKTVLIRRNGNNEAFAMYPNPVSDHVQFDISVSNAGHLEYKIIDNAGRVLQQHSTTATKGRSSFIVTGLGQFSPGNYILQVRTGTQSYNRKLIKN